MKVPTLCVQAAKSQMRLRGCLCDKYQNHTSWLIYIAQKKQLIEIVLLSLAGIKSNLINTVVIK